MITMNKDYNKDYLKDLESADLKDTYDKHWAFITMYVSHGDRRMCPNCQGCMEYTEEGDFPMWNCLICDRREFLCTTTYDYKLQKEINVTPYWNIESSEDNTNTGVKYWE